MKQVEKKPYAKPQLTNHGAVEVATQVQPRTSDPA